MSRSRQGLAARLGAVLLPLLAVIVTFSCAWPPQATAADVTVAWTPPDTTRNGRPITPAYIRLFLVGIEANGEDIGWAAQTDSTFTRDGVLFFAATLHELDPYASYRFRVAAVDTLGRQGDISLWSDPIVPIDVDPGPPAAATVPMVIKVVTWR